jgi:hypothetical protein
MKPSQQPQLPAMPRDFSQPITVRGSELAQAIAEAQAQGYHAHRMKVLPEVIYELQFWKLPAAEAGKHFREPSKTEPEARQSCTPDSPYTQPEN